MRDYKPPGKNAAASGKGKKKQPSAKMPSIPVIRGLLFLLAGLLILLTGYTFLDLQTQPVSDFQVQGNQVLKKETIIDLLQLEKNHTFWELDPYELSVRVIQHPWVETARVKKRYPNRIEIWVVEKKPVSFLRSKSQLHLLDKQGNLLPVLARETGWDFPVITDTNYIVSNASNRADSTNIQRALKLLDYLDGNPVLPLESVSEIQISNPVNFQIVTTNDIRIDLGMERFPQKLELLSDAMAQLETMKKKIRRLDLRYNTHLIVQKK